MTNPIQKLYELGQSVWCDNISRSMIDSGELQRLIDLGIVGVTSNPTIFMKAITGSNDYDECFAELLSMGVDDDGLYEGLVMQDIADAADILLSTYEDTHGVDGYISLEVSPRLAYDTEGTVQEGYRLFTELDRPNIYIKVPATDEGIPAIRTLISLGVSVNVTLIFSIATYELVMQAYIEGLRDWQQRGGDVRRVNSVASFFISRVDSMVDDMLTKLVTDPAKRQSLQGRAAIANAKLAYERFEQVFLSEDGPFAELRELGAHVQRPLWASTSTKNPAYPDTIYVDQLVAPHSVNTMPPATITATLDHGKPAVTIHDGVEQAHALMAELASLGIDIHQVTSELRTQGVNLFAQSFEELYQNLASKREALSSP